MKIIVSHDVDHLTASEHLTKDTILPRFLVRAQIELLARRISLQECLRRFASIRANKWNGVEELLQFEQARNIKSSWFIGVNNGLGLAYSVSQATPVIRSILEQGFEVGVHGIEFADADKVAQEHATFARISGRARFGIRMHYLRCHRNTLRYLAQAGYAYDATKGGVKNPYRAGALWEFPLQIMDGWIMNGQKRWQSRNLEQAKQETLARVDAARSQQLKYLTVLFHDHYFSDGFATWKNWYVWLVGYLLEQGYEFVTYEQALREMGKPTAESSRPAPRA